MWDRLKNLREILHTSLWLLPMLITGSGILLAIALLAADRRMTSRAIGLWLFPGGPEAAREVVGVIAGSVIGVGGVAFSITVVALSLAGSQYGSLQLVSYLRDRLNQFVLGTFVGTFVYCLIVLGNIGAASKANEQVPEFAVTMALLLAIGSLGAFIAFIHHLSQSLQAEQLAARVGKGLMATFCAMYPEWNERTADRDDAIAFPDAAEPWQPIKAPRTGYLQAVEHDRALAIATENDLLVLFSQRAGDFVTEGRVIGRFYPANHAKAQALAQALAGCHLVGNVRTPTQDPEYSVHQLAQIAVRALSPGINDPYTALICVDWLEAALLLLAGRGMRPGARRDAQGQVRLVAPPSGFDLVADAVFNKIRAASRSQRALMLRLADVIEHVAREVRHEDDRAVLHRHLHWLAEDAAQGLVVERERTELQVRCTEVEAVLRETARGKASGA
jgi:uncharacterized membrane protein